MAAVIVSSMTNPGQMTAEQLAEHNRREYGGGQPAEPPPSGHPVALLTHSQAVTVTCAACGELPISDHGFDHATLGATMHAGEKGHQVAVHRSDIDLYGPPRENGET
jgi:hypothetical protein